MSNKEPNGSMSLSEVSPPYDLEKLVLKAGEALKLSQESLRLAQESLRLAQASVATQNESIEKLQAKVSWLARLEASRADHVLQLSGAVQASSQSKDHNTEAVLLLLQRFTEVENKIEFAAEGVATLHQLLGLTKNMDAAAEKAAKKAAEKMSKQIAREAREASRKIMLQRDEGEEGGGKVGALAKAYQVFARADRFTKTLTVLLAFLATSAFLGWCFYKLNTGAEKPQGIPIARTRVTEADAGVVIAPR